MVDLTFRTLGPWGAGKGANLVAAEVDSNFWSLAQAIFDLQNDPPVANGIASIAVSGTQMTITLTDGTVLGPYQLPVLTFGWRGEWQTFTAYAALDVVTVTNMGIYMVQIAHTSLASFDPDLLIEGTPAFLMLFGFGSGGAGGSSAPDGTMVSNISGITGPHQSNTLTGYLDHVLGSTRGSLMFRSATGWQVLLPGTSGYLLSTRGTAGDPIWIAPPVNQSPSSTAASAGYGFASAVGTWSGGTQRVGHAVGAGVAIGTGRSRKVALFTAPGTGFAAAVSQPTVTTFNPLDKAAPIALSNGNLTATKVAAGWSVVRTVGPGAGKITGKWYFRIRIDAVAGLEQAGIATTAATLTNFIGSDAGGWAMVPNIGSLSVLYGTGAGNAPALIALGDYCVIAFDATARKVWFTTQTAAGVLNANWNNNSATHNPSTGAGGNSMSASGTAALYPAFACQQNAQGTLDALTTIAHASLSGFSVIG